jgi:hypothetical protein
MLQPGNCHIWAEMSVQPDSVQREKQIECIPRAKGIFLVTPLPLPLPLSSPSAAARQERWEAMKSCTQLSAPFAPDKHDFSHILHGVPHG